MRDDDVRIDLRFLAVMTAGTIVAAALPLATVTPDASRPSGFRTPWGYTLSLGLWYFPIAVISFGFAR